MVLGLALGLANGPVAAVDLENGKEIMGVCAACHGELGQGGKKGEYPRLAGQRVKYLENQLRNFRSKARINIPMFPYTQDRELPDTDIKDVAGYLAQIELSTKMPEFKGDEDALTRLQMVDKVMIIPRVKGDTAHGEKIYQKECAACHGKTGRGKSMFPMLAGQYTTYLQRQVDLFLKGDRPHDEEGMVGILNRLQPDDVQDILAYLTTLQETTE